LKKLLAGSESPRSANRANIGISSSLFSIGYGSPAAALHLLLPDESAVEEASRSSVLAFDFFHSRFGSGRGGDIGGAAPAADPAASSWLHFFPLAAFAILDGDGFILQVQGVFTRIRSGATAVALSGGALGSTLHLAVAARTGGDFWPRCV
jgi:hypothetical protein